MVEEGFVAGRLVERFEVSLETSECTTDKHESRFETVDVPSPLEDSELFLQVWFLYPHKRLVSARLFRAFEEIVLVLEISTFEKLICAI